ncbi:hypothetical protein PFDG_04536 [Plasmodium falciparum Dd2]|uniref:Uncharacterized protein n=1 Tax=Plasmodium falciparum (isolate Dd2) TaxID=57267 RepID=A0A0L7M5M6_PLAF4|nr:hypothetical protein PFDG_04536 [Plasmodium falciparum Dd2]
MAYILKKRYVKQSKRIRDNKRDFRILILGILKLNEMNMDRHWCINERSPLYGKGLLKSFMWVIDDITDRIDS